MHPGTGRPNGSLGSVGSRSGGRVAVSAVPFSRTGRMMESGRIPDHNGEKKIRVSVLHGMRTGWRVSFVFLSFSSSCFCFVLHGEQSFGLCILNRLVQGQECEEVAEPPVLAASSPDAGIHDRPYGGDRNGKYISIHLHITVRYHATRVPKYLPTVP